MSNNRKSILDSKEELERYFNRSKSRPSKAGVFVGTLYRKAGVISLTVCTRLPKKRPNSEVFEIIFSKSGSNGKSLYPRIMIRNDSKLFKYIKSIHPDLDIDNKYKYSRPLHEVVIYCSGIEILNTKNYEIHHLNINAFDPRYSNLFYVPSDIHKSFHNTLGYERVDQPVPTDKYFLHVIIFNDLLIDPTNTWINQEIEDFCLDNFKGMFRQRKESQLRVVASSMIDLGGENISYSSLREHLINHQNFSVATSERLIRLACAVFIKKSDVGLYSLKPDPLSLVPIGSTDVPIENQ